MDGRRLDIVYGSVFLCITAYLFWVSIITGIEAPQIARDPMWYPQVLLILLMVCAGLLIVRNMWSKSESSVSWPKWRPLAVTLVLSGVFLMAFDRFGYLPTALVFVPLTSWLLGFRRPLMLVLITTGFICSVWYGFHYGLNATLPGPMLPLAN